jgi:hypothetical protein
MTYEHSARSTARAVAQLPKQMTTKAVFLWLSVSCCVFGILSLPTQAFAQDIPASHPHYNSGSGDAPDVRFGHSWITNHAIEYLKRIDPFAYVFAKKYREQLIYGAWYADHNGGRCTVAAGFFGGGEWSCDSANHYDPRFRETEQEIPFLDQGAQASVSASEYARDLFNIASTCLSFRDLPESALPDACRIRNWRAISDINLIGDFGDFSRDGPLVRIAPVRLLGWALHMVQDSTQVYHTYSEARNGHQEFENYVDSFLGAGKGDKLPSFTTGAAIEVSTPEGFVRDVARETREIGAAVLVTVPILNQRICCLIPDDQRDAFTEASLNRAIIYSAKLIRFYFRKPANGLAGAISGL